MRLPCHHEYPTSISPRVSLRDPDAGGATSNNFFDLWLVAGRKHDNFYGAPPGNPCKHDPRGRPNYGNRDGENRTLVLVCLLEAVVLT
jgi:hypothetical protein